MSRTPVVPTSSIKVRDSPRVPLSLPGKHLEQRCIDYICKFEEVERNNTSQNPLAMASQKFATPIPQIPDDVVKVSFPMEHVLHVAMNRPKQYNAMNQVLEKTMNEVFDWFESEPSLWVAILGSTNGKAWCAGQDLKEMVCFPIYLGKTYAEMTFVVSIALRPNAGRPIQVRAFRKARTASEELVPALPGRPSRLMSDGVCSCVLSRVEHSENQLLVPSMASLWAEVPKWS